MIEPSQSQYISFFKYNATSMLPNDTYQKKKEKKKSMLPNEVLQFLMTPIYFVVKILI